jgi:hypothetical protein
VTGRWDYTCTMRRIPLPTRRPPGGHARARSLALIAVLLALLASACVPASVPESLDSPIARAVERAAHEAFHRMELGRLATGSYTTNVLVDVDLPRGSRITLEDFTGADYRLRVDADGVPDTVWIVTPAGVRRVPVR